MGSGCRYDVLDDVRHGAVDAASEVDDALRIAEYPKLPAEHRGLRNDCGRAAILLGQSNWKEGVSYLFIKSAVALPEMEITEEHLTFTREIWNHVYEKNKEFFPEQEVVGWFLSIPGCSMELHDVICRTHLNHFGGNDKVLMVMEPLEKEEAFYRYEEGKLSRQNGFYVYYEKKSNKLCVSLNSIKKFKKSR